MCVWRLLLYCDVGAAQETYKVGGRLHSHPHRTGPQITRTNSILTLVCSVVWRSFLKYLNVISCFKVTSFYLLTVRLSLLIEQFIVCEFSYRSSKMETERWERADSRNQEREVALSDSYAVTIALILRNLLWNALEKKQSLVVFSSCSSSKSYRAVSAVSANHMARLPIV